mmetsp:Transcript_18267/g.64718  ORF Transcript_18267/g.64718 Transcript_18267/m.64718 type:complete len:204 (-) Transcript_18267:43-654(-)
MTPSDQMSHDLVYRFVKTSGAMKNADPTGSVMIWSGSSMMVERPKSASLRCVRPSVDANRKLSGLRSRWTTPFSWQCFTPSSICWNRHDATFSLKCLHLYTYFIRSPPRHHSSTKYTLALSSRYASMPTTCGWPATLVIILASRCAASFSSSLGKRIFDRHLIAYVVPDFRSWPHTTSPKEPLPSTVSSISYSVLMSSTHRGR